MLPAGFAVVFVQSIAANYDDDDFTNTTITTAMTITIAMTMLMIV